MKTIFQHARIFPAVARVITRLYEQKHDFVTHAEIVDGLRHEPEVREAFDEAESSRVSGREGFLVGAMVAWFSQKVTEGRSPWAPYFVRKRLGKTYAYRPVTAEAVLGADPDAEAVEREPRLVLHLRRERDRDLAARKKSAVPSSNRAARL